jgi:hypothetical protein
MICYCQHPPILIPHIIQMGTTSVILVMEAADVRVVQEEGKLAQSITMMALTCMIAIPAKVEAHVTHV